MIQPSIRQTMFAALIMTQLMTAAANAQTPQVGTPRRLIAADYQKKLLALVDVDNRILWQHPIRDIHDLQLLPNGNILTQTTFQNVVEFDPQGNKVWQWDARPIGSAKAVEIHAFERLTDGTTMIAESGNSRIIEVDRDNKIVKEIRLTVSKPHPHRDTRLVRKLANGNYLVAHEGDKMVREYNPAGVVVWDYNVGHQLYSVQRLDNGCTLIGCGDGNKVIEVTPGKEIVWSVTRDELPKIKLAWITMVERLPNGNTLIVNCHAGPDNPQIIEVDTNKKVVWTFKDFARFGNALPVARLVPTGWRE